MPVFRALAVQAPTFSKYFIQLTTNSQNSLFRQHAQMQENPHDGRTPQALFFTWDFIQRTRDTLLQIPVEKLEANDKGALEKYSDCVGRAIMAEMIVAEKTPVATLMRGG